MRKRTFVGMAAAGSTFLMLGAGAGIDGRLPDDEVCSVEFDTLFCGPEYIAHSVGAIASRIKGETEDSPDDASGVNGQDRTVTVVTVTAETVPTSPEATPAPTEATPAPSPTETTLPPGITKGALYMIGDSLTVGMLDSGGLKESLAAHGWTDAKIEAAGCRPLVGEGEFSACSYTDFRGRSRIVQPEDAAHIQKSQKIVIALGTNDLIQTPDTFEASARTLVDDIRATNQTAQILWLTLYVEGADDTYAQFNERLKKIGGVQLIDVVSPLDAGNFLRPPCSNDGVHPCSDGDKAMADAVVAGLGRA